MWVEFHLQGRPMASSQRNYLSGVFVGGAIFGRGSESWVSNIFCTLFGDTV